MKTFIIAALSADGFISKNVGHSSIKWRSKEDAKFFIAKTKEAGVVVMGSTTFNTMRRPMPGRLHFVYSYNPNSVQSIPGVVEVTRKEPAELLKDIETRGYGQVAICGGATIYTMFMEAGVVDELYLTIEPVVFGKGMNIFNKELDVRLKLKSTERMGGETVLLEYDVVK